MLGPVAYLPQNLTLGNVLTFYFRIYFLCNIYLKQGRLSKNFCQVFCGLGSLKMRMQYYGTCEKFWFFLQHNVAFECIHKFYLFDTLIERI